MTTSEAVVRVLSETDEALAVHEFGLMGVAQTAISARLRELAREGIVVGAKHPTKAYKVWRLNPGQGQLL